MSFKNYLKQLLSVTLTSSLALGIALGAAILIGGGFTAGVDLTLEFAQLDGLWLVPGLPLVFLLIFLLLSPLSFILNKLIFRKSASAIDE